MAKDSGAEDRIRKTEQTTKILAPRKMPKFKTAKWQNAEMKKHQNGKMQNW
jgi:hypothetical protein